jgi:hypothetical protein
MKRIVVKLSGMPFDPTYEIEDDIITIGDLVRVPGSALRIHQGWRDQDGHRTGQFLHMARQERHPARQADEHQVEHPYRHKLALLPAS